MLKSTSSKEIMDEYLRDESKRTGSSERIFFPKNEADVISILRDHPGMPVTVQGSRTGVTGGCVPDGGLTVNMEQMNQVLDFRRDEKAAAITVQPGVLLQTLRSFILPHKLFFPPDPTETTASLGGMVSCNSSGARSFRYGSIRDYVLALDLILPGGDKLHLERGSITAKEKRFTLSTCSGRRISGKLTDLQMPRVKKHTAGYYIRPDMDLIDLFIGAEGTLGIITSIKLKLVSAKKETWGSVIFLPDEASALALVKLVRQETPDSLSPEALEFFGSDTLHLLRQAQLTKTALTEMELIRQDACCAVYVEYACDQRASLIQAFEDTCHCIESVGGNPEQTWAAINAYHMEKLHLFRHAAPECINRKISEIKRTCPAITKLGTDMSVPDSRLEEVFSLYRSGLAEEGLTSAIFGHIGNNHFHVNVIPKNMDEFNRTKKLFSRWAEVVVAMDGTVSAEHGIGKLKTSLLKQLYSKEKLAEMAKIKSLFDPDWLLNRGNIFSDPVL